MIDLLSRARGWLAAREIDDRYLQEHESHAASLASLLAEVRREALEEAACVCLSHERGYKLAAEEHSTDDCGPLPEDDKADAVYTAAEAIRSLKDLR
jgi:hypothetical protein